MKNKAIIPIAIVLVVALLVLGIYFGFVKQSLLDYKPRQDNPSFQISILSQDEFSVTYEVMYGLEQPIYEGDCSAHEEVNFEFHINNWNSATWGEFIPGLQENVYFKAKSVDYGSVSAIINPCSGNILGETIQVQNPSAECYIADRGSGRAIFGCTYSGKLKASQPAQFSGLQSATLEITILKQGIQCVDDYQCGEGYECKANSCVEKQAPIPPKPSPKTLGEIFQNLWEWIKGLFSSLTAQTIVGSQIVTPGTQEIYHINMVTSTPDSDYTDGTYSVQYGIWALVDKNENIVEQGTWEEINGVYDKYVTITIPSQIGNYVLIGLIDQIDMEYNLNTNSWETINEEVILKEGIDISTKLEIPDKPTPSFSLVDFFKNIWEWITGLF